MTTATFKDGVLAVDSLASVGDWSAPEALPKLFSSEFGACVVTGEYLRGIKLIRALLEGRELHLPDLGDSARVIFLRADGVLRVYEFDSWGDWPPAPFFAWGSGSPVAWGAMAAGASAAEAVEIASRFDPHTGGKVCTYSIPKL